MAYLQRRMAEFSIPPYAVAASIAKDQRCLRAAKYRDASGNTWDGEGAAPQWVIQARSAGQSLEHFAVREPGKAQSERRTRVDWRDDPFADSRLATISPETR